MKKFDDLFKLDGRVAVVTGGGGLLGKKHAEILASAGGIPVLADIHRDGAERAASEISNHFKVPARAVRTDITRKSEVEALLSEILAVYGRVDILINNAMNNPVVGKSADKAWSRFENFSIEMWQKDLEVGLSGAFFCSQIIGGHMAKQKKGVIVNVASDLSVISPDQRLYREDALGPAQQPVKPVSYSVVKTGLIGLTRYLATYWAEQGVRVNAISPGGVSDHQPEAFVKKLENLIPLGRMAAQDEYQGAMLFLCSDASSYMTGHNLIVDGGRSCW